MIIIVYILLICDFLFHFVSSDILHLFNVPFWFCCFLLLLHDFSFAAFFSAPSFLLWCWWLFTWCVLFTIFSSIVIFFYRKQWKFLYIFMFLFINVSLHQGHWTIVKFVFCYYFCRRFLHRLLFLFYFFLYFCYFIEIFLNWRYFFLFVADFVFVIFEIKTMYSLWPLYADTKNDYCLDTSIHTIHFLGSLFYW